MMQFNLMYKRSREQKEIPLSKFYQGPLMYLSEWKRRRFEKLLANLKDIVNTQLIVKG